MGRGQLAVASEYLEIACGKGEKGACQDLTEALARRRLTLRKQADALGRARQPLSALARLVALEEVYRRMAHHATAVDESQALSAENMKVTRRAVKSAEKDLDARLSRGTTIKDDLDACWQLAALDGSPSSTRRRCERISDGFKLYAAIRTSGGRYAETLASGVRTTVKARRLALLEFVTSKHRKYNTRVQIRTGQLQTTDTGWYETRREKYHGWVPRFDRKGRPITRTVIVQPTAEEYQAAREANQPPPQPRPVAMQVYAPATGDYRYYARRISVALPYTLEVQNLRTTQVGRTMSGVMRTSARSEYHTYTGHPAIRKVIPPPSPEGRSNAAGIPSASALITGELGTVADELAEGLVKHVSQ